MRPLYIVAYIAPVFLPSREARSSPIASGDRISLFESQVLVRYEVSVRVTLAGMGIAAGEQRLFPIENLAPQDGAPHRKWGRACVAPSPRETAGRFCSQSHIAVLNHNAIRRAATVRGKQFGVARCSPRVRMFLPWYTCPPGLMRSLQMQTL